MNKYQIASINKSPAKFNLRSAITNKSTFQLMAAVLFLLFLFKIIAISQEDIVISGKGDDGYFWASVFYPDFSGIEYLYPNIAVLRMLSSAGLDLTALYLINLTIQFSVLTICIAIILTYCRQVKISGLWIFLWVATSYEILFVTVYLMRDLYIILCILIIAGATRNLRLKTFAIGCLAILRPFALIIASLFASSKTVITGMLIITFTLLFYAPLEDIAKVILMPNAVLTGREFDLRDVISARAERTIEGRSNIHNDVLSSPIAAPVLMIVRPLIFTSPGDTYIASNGLTGGIEFRNGFDPYILWQNLIIPVNCLYLPFLLIALYRGLVNNNNEQRKLTIIYLIATAIISIVSGQGRHHLMVSWLEPILISHAYKKSDIAITIKISLMLILSVLTMAILIPD